MSYLRYLQLCTFFWFQFFHITQTSIPPVNKWVTVECPARIDLAGGWSDTPPICYEHGGAVTNMALLIEGKVSWPSLWTTFKRRSTWTRCADLNSVPPEQGVLTLTLYHLNFVPPVQGVLALNDAEVVNQWNFMPSCSNSANFCKISLHVCTFGCSDFKYITIWDFYLYDWIKDKVSKWTDHTWWNKKTRLIWLKSVDWLSSCTMFQRPIGAKVRRIPEWVFLLKMEKHVAVCLKSDIIMYSGLFLRKRFL